MSLTVSAEIMRRCEERHFTSGAESGFAGGAGVDRPAENIGIKRILL